MNQDFWDGRYSMEDYVYGVKPNQFLKKRLIDIDVQNKSILFPAEGEGRNAVFSAGIGLKVFAFDYSVRGQEKALKLAGKNGVKIDYQLSEFRVFKPQGKFDFIGLIFSHFGPKERLINHQKCIDWLKPGGQIVLEAFSKDQLNFNSGGPKNIDMLYSIEELQKDFQNLKINYLVKVEEPLNEGEFHHGNASLIRLIATKLD